MEYEGLLDMKCILKVSIRSFCFWTIGRRNAESQQDLYIMREGDIDTYTTRFCHCEIDRASSGYCFNGRKRNSRKTFHPYSSM